MYKLQGRKGQDKTFISSLTDYLLINDMGIIYV